MIGLHLFNKILITNRLQIYTIVSYKNHNYQDDIIFSIFLRNIGDVKRENSRIYFQ